MPLDPPPPAPPLPATHGPLAAVLLYDGLCSFEFGIAAEVFGLERPEMGTGWYRFASCAVEPGPLHAQGGLRIQADHGLGMLDQADIIVIPGWRSIQASVPECLLDALREAHHRGARLVSICSGATVLAATGLLDGAEVATHWRHAEALQARYPAIRVDARSLYREHRRICSSAGSAAGIDLLLEIVRQDFGPEAANKVARRLVVPAQRRGSQAQYLARPVPRRSSSPLAPLLDTLRSRLAEDWSMTSMAAACAMSRRTFARHFAEATGTSPSQWLIEERLAAARDMLDLGGDSIERIADAVGFSSAQLLRHHFRRRLGISPGEYRAQRIPPAPVDASAPCGRAPAARCPE